jgi:hypothetical protein
VAMTPSVPFGRVPGSSDRSVPSSPAGWVEQWVKATTWWADPRRWSDVADGLRHSQDRMLLDLAEGILRQFTGRTVTLRRGGATLRLVLDSLRVEGSLLSASPLPVPGLNESDEIEVRIEAHDVEWAGCRLASVSMVAANVQLVPGLPARLSADVIDVTARARPADIIEWVQRSVGDQWVLTGDTDGLIVAQPRRRQVRLAIEPSLEGTDVNLELRRLEWRRFRVRVPGWLRVSRTRPVPPLPPGVQLVAAWREQRMVAVRVRLDRRTQAVSLDQARAAIEEGEPAFALAP